jgi:hypothetical protein
MPSQGQALPLPHKLFLLSLRPEKGRLDDDSAAVRGALLRAAAIAGLRLAGLLRDHGGKAERTNVSATEPLDPFLAGVLNDVPPRRRRGWFEVVNEASRKAEGAVRDRLVAAGMITVEPHRVLGLFPAQRIGLADPGPVEALRDRVRQAVREDSAADPIPVGEALLAVLAIDGNVSTVFGGRDLRGHSAVVRALRNRIDRELTGLRPATEAAIAVHRSPA